MKYVPCALKSFFDIYLPLTSWYKLCRQISPDPQIILCGTPGVWDFASSDVLCFLSRGDCVKREPGNLSKKVLLHLPLQVRLVQHDVADLDKRVLDLHLDTWLDLQMNHKLTCFQVYESGELYIWQVLRMSVLKSNDVNFLKLYLLKFWIAISIQE